MCKVFNVIKYFTKSISKNSYRTKLLGQSKNIRRCSTEMFFMIQLVFKKNDVLKTSTLM